MSACTSDAILWVLAVVLIARFGVGVAEWLEERR